MVEKLLYRMTEATETLGMSRTAIYSLIGAGELEAVHIGASVRITAASLRAFVERCQEAERGDRVAAR